MSIDPVKIALAQQRGVSPVCSTCSKYWEGRDRGLPDPKCTAVKPCGSPLVGLSFPEYQGMLPSFDLFCFVCGGDPTYHITSTVSNNPVAACEDHIKMLVEYTAQGKELPGQIPTRLIRLKNELISEHDLLPKNRKKTLGEAIKEADDYFDEQALKGKKG